ncbi:MAG: mannitol dehydrogenase family protein [Actinomycetota bacterium]
MPLTGSRTFVGFGFGPIQAGLFLQEAWRSGAFGRLVVAEIVPDVVAAVRASGGMCTVNVAHCDRVERVELGPVEIVDPDDPVLVEAIAAAHEIATAVPSVAHYDGLRRPLAEGLRRKTSRAVVYAAENHNHAAELLEQAVGAHENVRFLNTVIGKMSRVVDNAEELRANDLAPVVPGLGRGFLVEEFNRILVSRVRFARPFERGLAAFEEKDDLLPFEEAKLYGHNATHALGGYLGALRGARLFSDVDFVELLRAAFVDESGAALIRRHAGVDSLFTPGGYRAYADDLLERMMNPLLLDTIDRVTRDPDRKLGWSDRLVGTIRLAWRAGVPAPRYALGACAAVAALEPAILERQLPLEPVLAPLWDEGDAEPGEREAVLSAIDAAQERLRAWLR